MLDSDFDLLDFDFGVDHQVGDQMHRDQPKNWAHSMAERFVVDFDWVLFVARCLCHYHLDSVFTNSILFFNTESVKIYFQILNIF